MQGSERVEEIRAGAPLASLHRSLTITDAGLVLGRRNVLARMTQEAPSLLAIDGEEERILAMLSVAFGKSVSVRLIENLRRASEHWSRGDKCLAYIHLAFAGLPQIGEDTAKRLALADEALAKGASPRALLNALGLDSAPLDALKFNQNQTRVPAGSGPESGRWTSGDGGSGTHGRPIDPIQTPTVPIVGLPSWSVLIGNNPRTRPSSNRINSDLPGGLDKAKTLFESLTKGRSIKMEVTKDGTTRYFTHDSKTQLRINSDGSVRIDREIELNGKDRETIHFSWSR